MANAKIDSNRVAVGLAANGDDPTQVIPIYMDPTTKRIQIAMTSDPTLPATLDPKGKIDANRQPVMYAVTDDAAQDVVPISTDASGNILIDLMIG